MNPESSTSTAASGTGSSGFDVVLVSFNDSKMITTKIVKDYLGLSVSDAIALIEKAPVTLKTNMPRPEAEAFMASLKSWGATVELRQSET